jgi:hypothetical protein
MELRLYSFVNFYLSSIQQGIQTGHVAVELVRKYSKEPFGNGVVSGLALDWADHHKTFITLNGGNNASLIKIRELAMQCRWPFAVFHEDEQSLDNLLTAVAIVVPESVYNAKRVDPAGEVEVYEWVSEDGMTAYRYFPGQPDHDLIKLLKSSRLAS